MTTVKKSTVFVTLILCVSCVLVIAITLGILYFQHVEEVKERLVVAAQSQARLIEAVARYDSTDAALHPEDHPDGAFHETVNQIRNAHRNYLGFGETGEFTLAQIRGDSIVFQFRHRLDKLEVPESIALNSSFAEPMRRALNGRSGIVSGLDYRGVQVLAAHEPVSVLNMGIVAKIDMAEVRAPFATAACFAALLSIVIVLGGVYFVIKATRPLMNRLRLHAKNLEVEVAQRKIMAADLEKSRTRLRDIAESSADWFWEVNAQGVYTYCSEKVAGVLGYTSREIIGKTPFDLMRSEQAEKLSAEFQRIAALKKPIVDLENWNLHKDGHEVCLLTNGIPLLDKDGNLLGYRGADKDITERKRAEAALRESEEQFRLISSTAQDAIITIDAEGCVEVWNKAAERLFGYSREEVQGKPVHDLIVPESYRSAADKGLRRFIKTGEGNAVGRTLELTARRKDGHEFPIELSLSAAKRNEKRYTIGMVRDITVRNRAEEELRANESLLRTMAENYPNSILSIIEKDYTVGFSSGQEFTKQNLDPNDLVGLTLDEIYGDKAAIVRKHYEETFCGKECSFELFMNDQYQYYRTVPLYAEDGSIPRIFVVVENITERKQAEEGLKKFKTISDQSRHGAVIADPAGILLYVNPALTEMYGYESKEIIGKHFSILHSPDQEKEIPTLLSRLKTGGGISAIEVEGLRSDGTTFPSSMNVSRIKDENGDEQFLAATIVDISEIRKAREERELLAKQVKESRGRLALLSSQLLESQEQERRRIARELHDEIGANLTTMKVNVQYLINNKASRERPDLWRERLTEQINLIDSTVDVVRNLALDLRPSILDDFGLVPAIRWYLTRQLKSAGIRGSIIEEAMPDSLPPAAENACFRVLQEAVTNIRKHARASSIEVTIGRTLRDLRLVVRDDGIGFNVEEARRRASLGESFGLLGMQERLGLLGGTLTIRSTPTEGTELVATCPINPDSSDIDTIHEEGNLE